LPGVASPNVFMASLPASLVTDVDIDFLTACTVLVRVIEIDGQRPKRSIDFVVESDPATQK
jgi:hypothetical protein